MMYKVLIADDEPIFREYLRNIIDWQNYGFEICAEARNGVEAIKLAHKHKPHIAVLDISMPKIDGIALSRKLKEQNKDIIIIFVTGHSEFEYARKAIKLGVEDYILKPFTREDLLTPLLKIKNKLKVKIENEKNEELDKAILRENFLNRLLNDEPSGKSENVINSLHRLGIDFYENTFIVISVNIDDLYRFSTNTSDISLWRFAVRNILDETAKYHGIPLTFNGPEGRIISVINYKNPQTIMPYDAAFFNKLYDNVKKCLDLNITIGISKPFFDISDIRKGYMESILALSNIQFEDNRKVVEYGTLQDKNMSAGFYRLSISNKILEAVRTNDISKIGDELLVVEDYIRKNRINPDFTNTILLGLVSVCMSHIIEMDENISNVFGENFSPYKDIVNISSLESAFSRIKDIYNRTIMFFTENRVTRTKVIVEDIKAYIIQNYSDNELSVESVARSVFLDPSYIRKLFIKEMGTTVSDYITKTRMQKAKELLYSKALKISEVSLKVGYSDPGYFSKCYKKYLGISP